jgi:6-pyruvoyltetrahydropterin/6-carboxytetrahydropterin synthase
MYSISKDFSFDASHQLTSLPAGHKCSRLHGHTYRVRVELASEVLDEHGMVWDYANLGRFKRWIENCLDHRHLNNVITADPTAEVLAHYCWSHLPVPPNWVSVLGVGVSETPKTWAWWRP